jgi:hypothetical protein
MAKTTKNKTIKNKSKSNVKTCSQTFCKKRLKQKRDGLIKGTKKTYKKLLERQKEVKKKINAAQKNGNKEELEKLKKEDMFIHSLMNSFDKALKPENKAFDKIIMSSCNKNYCNPGCKNTSVEGTSFYDKLPADFIAGL